MSPVAKKPAALVPSAASAWGNEPAQKEHLLPSGNVMTLRRGPCMRRLIIQGVVPSTLLGVDLAPKSGDQAMSFSAKLFEEQRAAVVCAMSVTPPVVMTPLEDGEALFYDLLGEEDVQYIVTWAAEGLTGIAAFLELRRSDADGADSEESGDAPQ